jgi:signal transduction histidine kinase
MAALGARVGFGRALSQGGKILLRPSYRKRILSTQSVIRVTIRAFDLVVLSLERPVSSAIINSGDVGNAIKHRELMAVVLSPTASRSISFGDRILAVAELGARMLVAERCVIGFRSNGSAADGIVMAPCGKTRWDAAVGAVLSALDRRAGDSFAANGKKRARRVPAAIDSIERIYLSAREIEAIVKVDQIDFEWRIAAAAFSDGISAVRLIVVVRADWARQELEASLELIARTVFDEIELVAARGSLDFWRAQGAETGRQAAEVKRELRMEREAGNRLNEAVSTARLARPNERFARFGELVANGAGFDRWTVGIEDGGLLIVAASSSGCEQFDLAGAESALAENFRRRIKMLSASCVCIPFETGVIALVSRHANASAAKAEAMVERLAPFAASWAVERHAARRGTLARQLALRMFAAIDEERTRIARDLHDDQAQLLAAAKIALEGNPEAARAIFKQIEDELRHKTRELRPATLGATPLDEAIGREFARLKRAGVKATLIGGAAADKISRPVQQLCFQVVREALSNVIRHARAKSVKIAIEKVGGAARVSISDDGCGVDAVDGNGIGLAGVRERLELMGGTLMVESRPGRTTIVGEIPESP